LLKNPVPFSGATSVAFVASESGPGRADASHASGSKPEGEPTGFDRTLSMIGSVGFAPGLAVCATLLAAIVGLLLPLSATAMLMREVGPIEGATVVMYLIAVAALWYDLQHGEDVATRIALSVALTGFLARELDLHKTADGVSLLKLSSYADPSGPTAKLAVMGVALAVIVAVIMLTRRHGIALIRRARVGDPLACTVLSFIVLLVLSKICDRSPVMLAEYAGIVVAPASRHIVLAVEEIAELMLPMLVIVGLIQHRLTQRQAALSEAVPVRELAEATPR